MLRSGVISVLGASVLLLVSGLPAEEWNQFRGPAGDGHSSVQGLPTHWTTEENVAWRVDVPGKAWSSPICFHGRLYMTTAIPVEEPKNGQSLRVLCCDAKSGKDIWQKEVFVTDGKRSVKIHPKNSFASPTPITDGKRLFVHFGTHGTACLDLDGKILWTNEELIYAHVHGSGGSPVLVGNKLIVSCDGADVQYVVAINADTGKIAWKTPRKGSESSNKFAFTTPLVLPLNGVTQLISPGPGAVWSYNAETGEELWMVKYGNGYSVIPRPVYGNGLVYVCTGYNSPVLLAIRPDGHGDVTDTHVAWKVEKGVPHSASLLLIDKILYMVSDAGVASALDAESGKQLWTHRVGGNFSSSPLYAGGYIYLLDEAGKTTVIKPGDTYDEVAENPLEDKTQASYAVGDGALFVRTEKSLFRIQSK